MKKLLLFLFPALSFLLLSNIASAGQPNYTYPATYTATVGVPFTITPTPGGTAPNVVMTTPGLPTGWAISSTTGVITGTPTTAEIGSTTYTITLTKTGGGGGTQTPKPTITITVVAAPVFSYTTPSVFTYGTAITAFGPTGTGAPVTGATISPALPAGLTMSGTGDISGTPTIVSSLTSYTVTATGSNGGIGTATFTITVNPANLTITATGPTKTYGTALTTGTSTTNFTAVGAITGETVTSVTLTPNAAGLSATTAAGAAYTVTPSAPTGTGGFLASNYSITYNPYNGTVAQATLTITATGPTKTYGTALTTGTSTTNFTAVGTIAGQTVTSVTLTPDAAGLSATTAAGAAYTVTPSAATGTGGFLTSNYSITYNPYNGTVAQATLTVTATGPTKTYGTALTTGTSTTNFTATAGVLGETVTGVTLTPNAAGLSATTAAGAAYTVTPSAATGTGGFLASNYNITYNPYNGTVGQATLTVTATGPTKTYGTALTTGTSTTNFTAVGAIAGQAVTSVTLTPNAAGLSATTAAGAAYTVTPSAPTGTGGFLASNYSITYNPYNGTVAQATLTITATGPTKTYGTALTTGTSTTNFTAVGTIAGQAVTSVTLTPDAAGLSATTAAGAAYTVTPSAPTGTGGFLASNYSITYNPYNGTVAQATLTITATGPTKTYGTALTTGTSTTNFTAVGTIAGQTVTSVTLTPNAAGLSATTAAGAAYTVTPSAATGTGGFLTSNYSITYNPYNGTVAQATLTVTATGPTKTYGTALTTGTSTTNFTATAGVLGETVTGVTLTPNAAGLSATTAAGAAYTVTPSAATGTGGFLASNYNITYNPYNGTVGQATLTVTATGPTKTYGTALTTGTSTTNFTAVGAIAGQAVTSVTLTPNAAGLSATTAAGAAYTVTPSAPTGTGGFLASNYSITYNPYNGTVAQATLTITATGPTKTYGTALTTGTSTTNFTAVGTIAGQAVTSVTLTPDAAGLSATTAAGAAYTVTPSAPTGTGGFLASNYSITYNPYNGTVAQATLTITATGPTKTYGTALTTGTSTTNFTAVGTIAGQTVTSVTLTPNAAGLSATTAAGAAYTVTPSAATGTGGFLTSNYSITYNPYNGTVAQATLTVTATGPTKTYGTALTTGTSNTNFTAVGAIAGQAVTSVTLTPNAAGLSATTAAGAAYTVTPSAPTGTGGFLASNYSITYNPYNGTVGQATLTITASTNNKTYGTTLTGGTITTGFTYSGQQNGQTVTSVTAAYGTGSAATDPVGTYTNQIIISAAAGTFSPANYNVIYNTGNIVVGQATLTITANNVTKTIGNTLTSGAGSTAFTYSGQQNGETVGTVTITYGTAGAAGAALGTYANQVTPSAATGGTFTAGNYAIVYVSGSITVIDHPPVLAYNTPNVYPVNEAISTLSPTTSGGGTVIAPAFNSGTNLRVTPNFNGPQGMAFDASGNLYVVNNNGTIDVFNSSGTSTGTFGSGLTNPVGMVFDASGNAYVLDATKNKVYEFNSGGTLVNTLSVTGLNGASAIAIDSSGNLYIANTGANDVLEVNASTGSISKTITSNINAPTGVAIDNSGNIYVTNAFSFGTFSSTVTKYTSSGTYSSTFKTDGLGNISALSIDASGNVYTADDSPFYDNVYQFSSTGTTLNTIGGWNTPEGIIADTQGDMYVSDNANNTVTEYNPTGGYYISGPLPPGLSFSSTTGQITGTPTSVFSTTSYTVTAYNSGGSGTSNTFTISCYLSFDWVGTQPGGDWNTAANWASLTIPGSSDVAKIGVDNTFTYAPVVSTTGATTVTVGSVLLGNAGGKTSGITVNTSRTLVVVGDITAQSDANSTMGYVSYLSGAGTVQAVNLNVNANTALSSGYTEQINSSVTSLQLSGNIALTSTKVTHAGNAKFIVSGGVTSLTGTGATGIISTTNQTGAISTISVTAGTLQWANATGLSGLSAVAGTTVLSCTGTGVIGYSGANQTVYTDLPVTGLASGVSYQGISFSGTGVKTPNGTSSNNLNIAGSFTNSLANDATDYVSLANTIVNFNGTTAQALAGGTASQTHGSIFNSVNFINAGVKTMSGNFYVAATGTLTMSSGASLVAGDNATSPTTADAYLTLLSTATNTAAIAQIVAGTSITGNVNVQRYISGIRGYRLISSPVYAGTANGNKIYSLNSLLNSLYLTGTGGGFTSSGNPTLYLYDEGFAPQYTTFLNSNFIGVADITSGTGATPSYLINVNGGGLSTSSGYNIPVGNGYYCFFRGNLSEGSANLTNPSYPASAATITATGNITQGQVNFADWYTPTSTYLGGISQNFNLVGNPYASAIDLSTVTGTNNGTGIYATTYNSGTNTGITKFIYELNPVTNIYGVYTDDGSLPPTNGASQYIANGQGFFVQAFGANNAQLVFNESCKAASTNANAPGLMARRVDLAAINSGGANPLLELEMSLDSVHSDQTIISFNPNAHTSYVFNEDAPHRTGGGLVGFASMSGDNVPMSVNTMPLQQTQTIPLRVFATNDGIYSINLSTLRPLPALYEVWLKDAFMKDSLDIKDNPVYRFNIANADTSTYGAYRLSLVIRENPALMIHLLSFGASKVQGGDQVIWTTENEQNYTNFTVERSTDGGTTFNELEGLLSTAQSSYNYLDKTPVNGPNMYRLKIVDLNGTVSYSNVVTIMYANTNGQIAINGMMVYPNPTTGNINLSITSNTTNGTTTGPGTGKPSYDIEIVNNLGSVIKSAKSSSPQWQSDVTSLTPGTYFIRVIDTGNNTVVGRSAFVKL